MTNSRVCLLASVPFLFAIACGDDSAPTDGAVQGRDGATSISDAGLDGGVGPFPASGALVHRHDFTRPEAAFDGNADQSVAEGADGAQSAGPIGPAALGQDWNCAATLQGLTVVGPTDGPIFNVGSGTIAVYGRRAGVDRPTLLATQDIEESPEGGTVVVFEGSDFTTTEPFTRHTVWFSGATNRVRVAEIIMDAECSDGGDVFAWQITPGRCIARCEERENRGQLQGQQSECLRNGEHPALEEHCGERPPEDGGACILECPYDLSYIGPRTFTYDNGSGWLHEGVSLGRAGPLPLPVANADSREAIEGRPCSIETIDPETYFTAVNCIEGMMGPDALHCAFRCEAR